jgi:hypothetical protein
MEKNNSNLSRYFYGETNVLHKGVSVKTSLGTPMDDFIANIDSRFNIINGVIPTEHEHRPDLTSNVFYDSPRFWWLILQVNNINDPFENMSPGDAIKIPDL